jgi:DNA polymerase-3 subunit epsilon
MEIIVFDTETTGLLQPENSDLSMQPKIIEFYAVKLSEEFEILGEINELIHPGEPITEFITGITGITNDMVKDAPMFIDVAEGIVDFFYGVDLSVAHNHGFDSGMLDVEFKRLEREMLPAKHQLCTVEATMGLSGHRLTLSRLHWMLIKQQFKAHRAKDDVFALVRCLHNLTESGVIKFDEYNSD